MTTYTAKSVDLFFFDIAFDGGYKLDDSCYCHIENVIPVYFSGDDKKQIGTAKVKRLKKSLKTDFTVKSSLKPATKALGLIQDLYPSLAFRVEDIDHSKRLVTRITAVSIILSPEGNEDPNVKKLGNKVKCDSKNELH